MTTRFNKEERTAIAEFVFSYQNDVLIKSDAVEVVGVLRDHSLIENPDKWLDDISNQSRGIGSRLLTLIGSVIENKDGEAIMDEYYGAKPQIDA
jgi:hypothetical protein